VNGGKKELGRMMEGEGGGEGTYCGARFMLLEEAKQLIGFPHGFAGVPPRREGKKRKEKMEGGRGEGGGGMGRTGVEKKGERES
jgi:hypothetical protein